MIGKRYPARPDVWNKACHSPISNAYPELLTRHDEKRIQPKSAC